MVDTVKINAVERTDFGKGAARRLRRNDMIPAVVYGLGGDTDHIAMPGHETFLAIRGNANALLTVPLAGKDQMVLVKDVQRNPVTRLIEHLDLLAIRADETVVVTVPITTEGEPAPGMVVTTEVLHIEISAPVLEIPESIVIDVEGKEQGTQIRVADVKFPAGVSTDLDPEELLVSVNEPIVDEELEAADAAAAEEAAEESADGAADESAEESADEE